MFAAPTQRLQPIDLLRIYGNIEYDWNLRTDAIEWQGSLMRLISPDVSLATGSSFCNLLNHSNFQQRMIGIAEARNQSGDYSISYHIMLSSYEQAKVIEEGKLILGFDNQPLKLEGYIQFIEDNQAETLSPLSGYDGLTGFPEKEVLFENLASLLTKSLENNIPGAYMAVSIDQLNYINAVHGSVVVEEIIKSVSEKLRTAIRFNDSIGRISSTCFGIILQECDRWGVIHASQRLTNAVEACMIETSQGSLPLKISCGGIVFPDRELTAEMVMRQAEKCLFDAQSIKGSGIAWTPYGDAIQPELQRDHTATKGRQRAQDIRQEPASLNKIAVK